MPRSSAVILALSLICSLGVAQGPDVIVGSIPDVGNYGSQSSIAAFSLGTTSCNVGTAQLQWFALPSTLHPVIAQDLYRVKGGRLEHIGMSWLKHGFTALQGTLCSSCNASPTGTFLGVGCSDPYGAGLNGSQGGLGPRSDVNASTGVFPVPNAPPASGTIGRRLQVHHADLNPAQNVNAVYFGAAQYVARDDAQANNKHNNASWRLATVSPNGASYNLQLTGQTIREKSAVEAWAAMDSQVQTQYLDIPSDGRIWVGYKGNPDPNGTRHTIAIQNLNSHESIRAVEIGQSALATVSGFYFNDVDYHSGEPYALTDWTSAVAPNGVMFQTQTFAQNQNANALRWGTTYTFEFVSNEPIGSIILTTFRSGQQHQLTPFGVTPPPPFQINQPGKASMDINSLTNDGETPIIANLGLNEAATFNYSGTAGAPYDIGLTIPDPVASFFVTANGMQVLNLDLASPTFALLFGGTFANAMPGSGVSIPFTTPNQNLDVAAQLTTIDAASPDGYWLSAAVDLRAAPCQPTSQSLSLSDDSTLQIAVGPGTLHDCITTIPFGGSSWGSINVNSNGSASFGFGNTSYTPTASSFNNSGPQLCGAWGDLNPATGGAVTVTSAVNGTLTVGFASVPAYSGGGVMSFDLEFDTAAGSCAILNYQNVAMTTQALVGLNPVAGGASLAVNWASLAGGGLQTGIANRSVYQHTTNGAPSGFSSIVFPTANGASYIVN